MGQLFSKEDKQQSYKNKDYPRPGYYITPCSVFYRAKEIKTANSDTFKKLKNGWAKDKNSVYYNGKVIKNADPESFIVKKSSGHDKNGRWYQGKLCI